LRGTVVNRKMIGAVFAAAIVFTIRAGTAQSDRRAQAGRSTLEYGRTEAKLPDIRYIPGSTNKINQILGEEDKELHQPTLSETFMRYRLRGADLGYTFEHDGLAYFLFGDTLGMWGNALDSIATTEALNPQSGIRLDFLTVASPATGVSAGPRQLVPRRSGLVHQLGASPQADLRNQLSRPNLRAPQVGPYLTIQPPGISMGAFETPVGGISLGGQMYVVVRTNHSMDWSTDRTVLTKFNPPYTPSSFQPLRTMSQRPAGQFITMSLHIVPRPIAGLPRDGPFVIIWGTGQYRKSDAYLQIVPAANFESGIGTRYFTGLNAAGVPQWSPNESDAQPIVENGTMGDLSVTWCNDLGLWIMTYDRRNPMGIAFRYAHTPWGPWSQEQLIFTVAADGLGKFIHDPRANPPDGLSGPVIGKPEPEWESVRGGSYAPYVVERFTKVVGSELNLYYCLSTWNPYVVVLMNSRLSVSGNPDHFIPETRDPEPTFPKN